MSSDDDVHAAHSPGDVFIHIKTRVPQGNDLVVAQVSQFLDLDPESLHLVLKAKVLACRAKGTEQRLVGTGK